MATKFVQQLERAANRMRKRLEGRGEVVPDSLLSSATQDGLDVRMVLDAPRLLGREIDRLRRLVRRHGGRP